MIGFCMEALVSGVLLAGNVTLVNQDTNVNMINNHPYVLSDYTSGLKLCKDNEKALVTDTNIKDKISLIESEE